MISSNEDNVRSFWEAFCAATGTPESTPHHARTFSDPRFSTVLAVYDVGQTLREAKHCIERGFCTLFLPANVPWQPYGMDVYEPLWSLAEEADVVLNFHVFSGNLAGGSDFAHLASVSAKRHQRAKEAVKLERKGQLAAVTGMAVGMSPINELTGAGCSNVTRGCVSS